MFEALKRKSRDQAEYRDIEIDLLARNPYQTRGDHAEAIDQLAKSIETYGLQQPPKVWRNEDKWRICYGHQRIAAARKLGWKMILCRIETRPDYNLEQLALDGVAENLHRSDLSAIERATSFGVLQFSFRRPRKMLAEQLGISELTIGKYLAILEAPRYLQEACSRLRLGFSICKLLQQVDREAGKEATEELLQKLNSEDVSRSKLKELAKEHLKKERPSKRPSIGETQPDESSPKWFFENKRTYGFLGLTIPKDKPLDQAGWNSLAQQLGEFFTVAGVSSCSWKKGETGASFQF